MANSTDEYLPKAAADELGFGVTLEIRRRTDSH